MPRMCSWAALWCGALLALAACFPQFGEYGGNNGVGGAAEVGGGNTGGSAGSPIVATCDGGICIEVPVGWEGPVALSEPGGACSGDYADEVAAGETDLSALPTSCGCECGPASGSTCPSATVTRYFSDGCVNQSDVITVPSTGCTPISTQNSGSWTASALATGGSCPPSDLQSTPPAAFEQRVVCAAAAPPICEGGAGCAPRPGQGLEPRICVMEDGDVDCTSPSFGVKTIVYTRGHSDTRGCDVPCMCQPPTAICGGTVSGMQGSACGAAQDSVAVGTCDDGYVGSNQSMRYFPLLTTEGSCVPAPRVSVGAVTGIAPITLCCSGVL